ncbi:MAG: VanZ family protein, partial [bacterium]
VLYGNLKPSPPEQVFANSDKVGHIVSFIALAMSAKLALFRFRWYWIWTPLIVFSFVLEVLQGKLRPLRTFSFEDGYANVTGVLIAIVIMTVWRLLAPETLPISKTTKSNG